MPDQPPRPERAQIVTDWLDHLAAAEKHADEAKRLGDVIAAWGPGTYEVLPGVGATVSRPSRNIDEDRARDVLTPEQFAACCVPPPATGPKFTAAAAKAALPGALLELVKVDGRSSVKRLG